MRVVETALMGGSAVFLPHAADVPFPDVIRAVSARSQHFGNRREFLQLRPALARRMEILAPYVPRQLRGDRVPSKSGARDQTATAQL